jgi:glucose-1-phosphate cytidylyltransferase
MIEPESAADIPVVILAGGDPVDLQGRLQPKAYVSVAGRPMLAHVVSHYSAYGFQRFMVCSGAGHEQVVQAAEVAKRSMHATRGDDVEIGVVFTGERAGTARRLRKALRELPHSRTVAVTYVDIVSDVDLTAVRETHETERAAATLTAVNLPTRFKPLGVNLFSARVRGLANKPITEDTLVAGGYYFLNRERFAAVAQDWSAHESFEQDTLPCLAAASSLVYHKHDGYWQPIDSARDVRIAETFFGREG